MRCVKHASRSGHSPSPGELLVLREAHWQAETGALRQSLAESELRRLREAQQQEELQRAAAAEQAAGARKCPAWPAGARQAAEPVTYELQVVTGGCEGAGTSARVFIELCGEAARSGEHRLLFRGASRAPFQRGATDGFRLHCQPLGGLRKVRRRGRLPQRAGSARWQLGGNPSCQA